MPESLKKNGGNDPEKDPKDNAEGSGGKVSSAADPLSGGRWTALFVVGAVILLAFGLVMIYMLSIANDKGTNETVWNRQSLIFAAAEAIAFTAVGWMFGREVNRTAAEGAGQAQKEAQAKTAEASGAAAKGESLAQAVITSAAHGGRAPDGQLEGVTGAALGTSNSQLDSLRDLAQRLFPEAKG